MDQEQLDQASRRVLIIEDEQFISQLYIRALTKAGYTAKIIIDGNEALQEALTNTYDIILLDIMLPNLTGTEILRELSAKQDAHELKAKIIITTNLEMSKEDRSELEAQADGYIIKAEITPKELVTYLDQLQLN